MSTEARMPPEAVARHHERLDAFTLRARRVEAHSLMADIPRFNKWVEGTTSIGLVDGAMSMTQDVPPEEAFESLAARCRPFLLNRDPTYWQSTFAALRAFLKGKPRFGDAVEELRQSWSQTIAPQPDTGFAVARPDEVESQAVWFATLADSWLYGDLVHADPVAREKAAGHTLNSRYCSAVLLYGGVALHVVATLNLIRQANRGGLLEIAEKALSDPVTAKVPMTFPVVGMVQAEVGTPMTDMLTALDQTVKPPEPGHE